MNIKLMSGGLLLVVALGAGGYYLATAKSDVAAVPVDATSGAATVSEAVAPETADSAPTSVTTVGTLPELLSKSGNLHCTFSHSEKDLEFKGDVYISDSKLRADVNAKVALLGDKTIETHTVAFDGFAYAWTNLAKQGTKMQIPEGKTVGDLAPTSGVNSTRFKYTCSPETVDQSLFSVPSGIDFQVAFPQG